MTYVLSEGENKNIMKVIIISAVITFLLLFISDSENSSQDYLGVSDEYEQDESLVTRDNWSCTSDCSGHEAGYEWASKHGVDNPDDCGGKSNSFIEGCEAYANEQIIEEERNSFDDYQYSNY